MAPWGKKKQLVEEPEVETSSEKFKLQVIGLLRIVSALCGAAVSFIGFWVTFATGKGFEKDMGAFEMQTAKLVVGFFQFVFGLLIIAGEMRLRCIARLFGFLALRAGKGCLLIFCGALLSSIDKAFLNNVAPLVVGVTCLAVGFLQVICALPCGPCTLPSDPLRKSLGTGKPEKAGGKKGRGGAQELDEPEPQGKRGFGAKLFRGNSSSNVEVDMESGGGGRGGGGGGGPSSNNPFARGGGGGGAATGNTPAATQVVAASTMSAAPSAKSAKEKKRFGSSKKGSGKLPPEVVNTGGRGGGAVSEDFGRVFGGGGGGGGGGSGGGVGGRCPAASVPSEAASDNPFCGNRHLKSGR